MPRLRTALVATLTAAALVGSGLAASAPADATVSAATLAATHPGLQRLLADGTPSGRAIVELRDVPTPAQVTALRSLGLTVQPMHALPMAIVSGPTAGLVGAVSQGLATDVYPDERIHLLDTASSNAMSSTPEAARSLRSRGFTGKGVTVAVVDSGCDATQPDLADRVRHNVTLVSPEYANQAPSPDTTLVVPEDQGPYSNSDIGGGHGTHVAGIIAADSSSVQDGSRLGVAPGATLDCFAIGQVLFTTAVVTAYDYMLSQPGHLGIDVVNNSWGNSYRQFDPTDPVAVATKAIAEKGVTVVFAAGNSGSGAVPMSLNPFSQSPWVISVAAGTLDRHRGDFSSNGLVADNSEPDRIGSGGHTAFTGDRIGLVHPDVTAPGVDISSTCASTGTVVGPCPPGENTSASGTSMASPHVAGAAAVLLQAQPRLTPSQVRLALTDTATPVRADAKDAGTLPFWQVGFGYANLDRAVALVRSDGWRDKLRTQARHDRARVLAADPSAVRRTDFWTYAAPPATFQGTDTHTYGVRVGDGVRRLRVSLAFPSGGTVGASLFSYTVTVKDPSGRTIATSATDPLAGSGTALATVPVGKYSGGRFTFVVTGDYAASDPDTVDSDSALGRVVVLHVAQLARD